MSIQNLFQQLPSVNRILEETPTSELIARFSRGLVVKAINEVLNHLRLQISEGRITEEQLTERLEGLTGSIEGIIQNWLEPSLRPVINATGVVVFTNAGRSPLSVETLNQVSHLARYYTNLEYDLEKGERGHRDLHFEQRVQRLFGSEAATVCNNAAAAILLILNTLALGKKVLVSRGELIEIGGSFRLPEVMERSGAVLKEVGTTNKTKAADYRNAIDPETALILRVHPSNYQIVGFTQRPSLQELVEISRTAGIPLLHDAGSGYLFRTELPFLSHEPVISESLEAGSDLVCFSGDKLLGGPQAGLIIGRRELISRIRKNPLMRALRVDKLTYASLEATLRTYQDGSFRECLPAWKMMSLSADEVRERAETLIRGLSNPDLEIRLESGFSVPGGGSAPEERIPTCLISIVSAKHSADNLVESLRRNDPPILTRIEEDRVLIDLRTVFPEQEENVQRALAELGSV